MSPTHDALPERESLIGGCDEGVVRGCTQARILVVYGMAVHDCTHKPGQLMEVEQQEKMDSEAAEQRHFKVDLHCHILPKRWPDLKEVRMEFWECGLK